MLCIAVRPCLGVAFSKGDSRGPASSLSHMRCAGHAVHAAPPLQARHPGHLQPRARHGPAVPPAPQDWRGAAVGVVAVGVWCGRGCAVGSWFVIVCVCDEGGRKDGEAVQRWLLPSCPPPAHLSSSLTPACCSCCASWTEVCASVGWGICGSLVGWGSAAVRAPRAARLSPSHMHTHALDTAPAPCRSVSAAHAALPCTAPRAALPIHAYM